MKNIKLSKKKKELLKKNSRKSLLASFKIEGKLPKQYDK